MTTPSEAASESSDTQYLMIRCPSCESRYRVPEKRVQESSDPWFHCSRCDNVFQATEDAPEVAPQIAASTEQIEISARENQTESLFSEAPAASPSSSADESDHRSFGTAEDNKQSDAQVVSTQSTQETVVVEFDEPAPAPLPEWNLKKDSEEASTPQKQHEPLGTQVKTERFGSTLSSPDSSSGFTVSSVSTLSRKVEVAREQETDEREVESFQAAFASLANQQKEEGVSQELEVQNVAPTRVASSKNEHEPEQVSFGFQESPGLGSLGGRKLPQSPKPAPLSDLLDRVKEKDNSLFFQQASPSSSFDSAQTEERNVTDTLGQEDTQRISPKDFHAVQAGLEFLSSAETEVLPEFQLAQKARGPKALSPTRSLFLFVSPLVVFLSVLFVGGQTLSAPDLQWLNEKLFPATPKAPPAELRVAATTLHLVSLADGKKAYALRGTVENLGRESIGAIQIEGALFDKTGTILETARVPLGSDLLGSDLEVLSLPIIQDMMRDANFRKAVLKPESEKDFMLVFTSGNAARARFYTARIHSAKTQ